MTKQAGAEWFPSTPDQKPADIARAAIDYARRHFFDVLLVDTAGRLAIDEALMAEIKELHAILNPVETLFVVDAMQGQDAVNTAKAFKEALPLTGIILTKTDGDSRGGAALSVRQITGAPIKLLGHQRKDRRPGGVRRRAPCRPHPGHGRHRGAGRAGGRRAWTWLRRQKLAAKIKSGDGFDLNDFLGQLQQMKNMGGLSSLLDKLPAQMAAKAGQVDMDKAEKRHQAQGRHHPEHDAAGAPQARTHQGHAQAPHRRRLRRARSGGQPPAQRVRADAGHDEEDEGQRHDEDDETHGRHEGHAKRIIATEEAATCPIKARLALN